MLGALHIDLQRIHLVYPLLNQKLVALHDRAVDPVSGPAVGIVSEGCVSARDLIVLQRQRPGLSRQVRERTVLSGRVPLPAPVVWPQYWGPLPGRRWSPGGGAPRP